VEELEQPGWLVQPDSPQRLLGCPGQRQVDSRVRPERAHSEEAVAVAVLTRPADFERTH
jgi:hypothetical protein